MSVSYSYSIMQVSCRLYNDMGDNAEIKDYHFIDREGNYLVSPGDEQDSLPEDALGFVVMSHCSCDSFDDNYPTCSDLELNIDEVGMEDVIPKAEFAKMYRLFERELNNLIQSQWSVEKKAVGVNISLLWESEYRSSQGHEDLYPDVDLDIRLLGTIRDYMEVKVSNEINGK